MGPPRAGLLAAALGAALLAGCSDPGPVVDAAAEAGPTTPARDAMLEDGGWPEAAAWIAREAAEGRPTVVNLFASWCAPCLEEAPVLRRAAQAHPDVAFLGIDHIDRRDDGEAFVAELDIGFDAILFDVAGDVATGIDARGMPTTAFFDRDGRMVGLHTGPVTDEDMADRLRELGVEA